MESIIKGLEITRRTFDSPTIGYRFITEAIDYIRNDQDKLSRRNMQIRELKLQVKKITADCYKAEADLAEYKLIDR